MLLQNMPVSMASMLQNSMKDFHTKGFDYLCLRRTPDSTLKIYFFDGDVRKLPEVVNPHDHRYDFVTGVVSGAVENVCFREDPRGEVYQAFDYRTPLNGGTGFTWFGERRLMELNRRRYDRGGSYHLRGEQLHTIRIAGPETILILEQRADKIPLGLPTTTYTRDREPPSLSGLYSRFTADEIADRLAILTRVAGFTFEIGD